MEGSPAWFGAWSEQQALKREANHEHTKLDEEQMILWPRLPALMLSFCLSL